MEYENESRGMHEEAVELGPLGVGFTPRRALQGVKASPIQSQSALAGDRLEDPPIRRVEGAARVEAEGHLAEQAPVKEER